MNELHELNSTQDSQETVLSMLPYDHAFLEAELGLSKVFVTNYGLDCEDSLAGERERLICVEEVTGGAVRHSLDLQEKQRGIYTELADADDCYIALLDTKQATEAEESEKLVQLAFEQKEQTELNQKAAELRAELANYATNSPGYHKSLHEKNSLLGQKFVTSGATISQLQAEIDGIRSDELPALEARIAKELEHIMQLYTSVLSITEQIGSLPAPADDPKNQLLYRNGGGAKPTPRATITSHATAMTEHEQSSTEASQNGISTSRHRQLGVAAVQSVVEEGGFLKRIRINFSPFKDASVTTQAL
ncbi:MAG: hypothetical protein ABI602_01330 [Candidatus Saccharibacteria bacterium]